ncbi:MAG: nucleotidyl transferase AbiEii/AbiGii toxin family protein [Bacteroidales bacterium]|jgi:predicted nucleotidyltransferase component of viral defense system|nr:nucleotidyl transferase AbiEii/AbiGii toxin family protein [Bacteroidales bacterium]
MSLLNEMILQHNPSDENEWKQAMRESMQIIALSGLYRGNFFENAAFYGGTCLRIFHGLDRFSEDMDFSLLHADEKFTLENWFNDLQLEFKAAGTSVEFERKNKTSKSFIESAFLKSDTKEYALHLKSEKQLKIKIEVDKNPPLKFTTENKLLLQPFSFFVQSFTLPSLFAGKMHALLFRSWKNRVKGRDWYDFEWYIRKGVALDLQHFNERSVQSGHLKNYIDRQQLHKLLINKINVLNFKSAKDDVGPFLKSSDNLEIWSPEYFIALVEKMKIA